MPIHPTAIVDSRARIDPSADIGPFCTVGPEVTIGPETRLVSHVVVDNHTTLGARNCVFPFASIGTTPQDLKFAGEPARLVIGDDNVIREGATLNIGTRSTMETRVGNHCLLMTQSHVAHDCRLGDHVVMANWVGLAGHVQVADHVTFGGLAAVHQYCRIGRYAFVAGGGMATQDVPPFCIAQGDRAELVGINVIGLKRADWERSRIQAVREAFKQLFLRGCTRLVALEKVQAIAEANEDVRELVDFVRQTERGVCPPRVVAPPADRIES